MSKSMPKFNTGSANLSDKREIKLHRLKIYLSLIYMYIYPIPSLQIDTSLPANLDNQGQCDYWANQKRDSVTEVTSCDTSKT